MKKATTRWIGRKAIGLFVLVVLSPAAALAFGPGAARQPGDVDSASLAVTAGCLLGLGLYRRKNP